MSQHCRQLSQLSLFNTEIRLSVFMQMRSIRLIFLENGLIEQSCLMYLAKQALFVNSNTRLSVNIKPKSELYFQVTKVKLLIFLLVIFSKYEKMSWRGKWAFQDPRLGRIIDSVSDTGDTWRQRVFQWVCFAELCAVWGPLWRGWWCLVPHPKGVWPVHTVQVRLTPNLLPVCAEAAISYVRFKVPLTGVI